MGDSAVSERPSARQAGRAESTRSRCGKAAKADRGCEGPQ
jgi:hypothetical protein